eukprot:COSAG02_NODE_24_length_52386_cov_726.042898_34_plen_651_part_00
MAESISFACKTGAVELDLLARLMRRQWLKTGETLVSEGEDANEVYFVLRGQLSIIAQVTVDGQQVNKPVNIVGAGCSIGQMGIVMEEKKRTASCRAETDCVVFFCHRYNFMRSLEPQILAVMKERATAVIAQNRKAVRLARRTERAEQRKLRREERYAAYVSGDAPVMVDSSSEDTEDSESDSDGSDREQADNQQNVSGAVAAPLQLNDDESSTDDQSQVLGDKSSKTKEQLALAHFMSGRAVTGGMDGMPLPGASSDTDRGEITGFRPVKLSQAPKPASPSSVENGSSKFSTFNTLSSRTSSPSTSPKSQALSKVRPASTGAETPLSESSTMKQPGCGFHESTEAVESHERLALASKQPVGSRRTKSPVAAAISHKLLTTSQDSNDFSDRGVLHSGANRIANLSPVQHNDSSNDQQVDRASVVGNSMRVQLGNQGCCTVVRPVPRRFDPSAVLLSESSRSPLFRRRRNITSQRAIGGSEHARQYESRQGDTPKFQLRRMQLRCADNVRQKQELSAVSGVATCKLSRNLETEPTPPSSPQQKSFLKGAHSKAQTGKVRLTNHFSSLRVCLSVSAAKIVYTLLTGLQHHRGDDHAKVILLRPESPSATRRRLAKRVKAERFAMQAAQAKRHAREQQRLRQQDQTALHCTAN